MVTPMLRATDQIRDTVQQMSSLALCCSHECCWHTRQRTRRGGGSKRGENRVGTEEKMDGVKKEGGGEKFAAQTSSAGRDPHCRVFLSSLVRK